MNIIQTIVSNPFELKSRVTNVVDFKPGHRASDFVPDGWLDEGGNVITNRNGRKCGLDEILFPGDSITVVRAPAGGGILISILVSAIIGIALYFLMGKRRSPDSSIGTSSAFQGGANTIGSGRTIPVGYGELLLGGHVIQSFTKASSDGLNNSQIWMLFALGQGEFEEIANKTVDTDWFDASAAGITNVFINENRAENFQNCKLAVRMGDNDQTSISGFDSVTTSRNVGLDLTKLDDNGDPLVITFTALAPCEAFEINIQFTQGCLSYNDEGNPRHKEVYARYRYQSTNDGLGWSAWVTKLLFSGIKRSGFTITIDTGILRNGLDDYELQIQRLTRDDDDIGGTHISATRLDTVNELVFETLVYPNIALLALTVTASGQLTDPNPTVLVQCKQRMPGVWWGVSNTYPVFFETYSNNPAHVALDILVNSEFGLGYIVDPGTMVDLDSFVVWADYCDELIAGDNGPEKRHVFDGRFDSATSGWDAFLKVCNNARGIPVRSGNRIKITVNEFRSPVQIFTRSNIVAGSFRIQWSSLEDRFNVIHGKFKDREQEWRDEVATVEGEDLWDGTGTPVERSEEMFGITRRTEAMRSLYFSAQINRLVSRVISFDVGVEGLAVEAGDIIRFVHEVADEDGVGGKVATGSDADTIYLDREAYFEPGVTYKVAIQYPDDTIAEKQIHSSMSGIVPEGDPVELTTALATVPAERDNYVIWPNADAYRDYMVTSIDLADDLTRSVEAVEHLQEVYQDPTFPGGFPVVDDVAGETRVFEERTLGDVERRQTVLPPLPTNLGAEFIDVDGTVFLNVSWDTPRNTWAESHTVFFKFRDELIWHPLKTVPFPTEEVMEDFTLWGLVLPEEIEVSVRPDLPSFVGSIYVKPEDAPSVRPTRKNFAADFYVNLEVLIPDTDFNRALFDAPAVADSERVFINAQLQSPGEDYTSLTSGPEFLRPLEDGDLIEASYIRRGQAQFPIDIGALVVRSGRLVLRRNLDGFRERIESNEAADGIITIFSFGDVGEEFGQFAYDSPPSASDTPASFPIIWVGGYAQEPDVTYTVDAGGLAKITFGNAPPPGVKIFAKYFQKDDHSGLICAAYSKYVDVPMTPAITLTGPARHLHLVGTEDITHPTNANDYQTFSYLEEGAEFIYNGAMESASWYFDNNGGTNLYLATLETLSGWGRLYFRYRF